MSKTTRLGLAGYIGMMAFGCTLGLMFMIADMPAPWKWVALVWCVVFTPLSIATEPAIDRWIERGPQ